MIKPGGFMVYTLPTFGDGNVAVLNFDVVAGTPFEYLDDYGDLFKAGVIQRAVASTHRRKVGVWSQITQPTVGAGWVPLFTATVLSETLNAAGFLTSLVVKAELLNVTPGQTMRPIVFVNIPNFQDVGL